MRQQFFLAGRWFPAGDAPALPEGERMVEWLPLRVGRLCLPVCLRRETVWTQAEQELRYSRQQAQALARRSCRAQLLAEFPDAVIEAERCVQSTEADGARCTVTYRFCADIAGTEISAPQT